MIVHLRKILKYFTQLLFNLYSYFLVLKGKSGVTTYFLRMKKFIEYKNQLDINQWYIHIKMGNKIRNNQRL